MNLSAELNREIEQAIDLHVHRDEHVGYLANLTAAASEDKKIIVALVIALRMDTGVPGEYITDSLTVDSPFITSSQISEHIAWVIDRMRQARMDHMRRFVLRLEERIGVQPHDAMECDDDGCMQPHEIG